MPTEINPKKMVKSTAVPSPKKYKESKTLTQDIRDALINMAGATPNMTIEEKKRSQMGTLSNNPEDEY